MVGRSEWLPEPRCTVSSNSKQPIRKAVALLAAYTLQTLSNGRGYRRRHRLAGTLRELSCELMRLLVFDV